MRLSSWPISSGRNHHGFRLLSYLTMLICLVANPGVAAQAPQGSEEAARRELEAQRASWAQTLEGSRGSLLQRLQRSRASWVQRLEGSRASLIHTLESSRASRMQSLRTSSVKQFQGAWLKTEQRQKAEQIELQKRQQAEQQALQERQPSEPTTLANQQQSEQVKLLEKQRAEPVPTLATQWNEWSALKSKQWNETNAVSSSHWNAWNALSSKQWNEWNTLNSRHWNHWNALRNKHWNEWNALASKRWNNRATLEDKRPGTEANLPKPSVTKEQDSRRSEQPSLAAQLPRPSVRIVASALGATARDGDVLRLTIPMWAEVQVTFSALDEGLNALATDQFAWHVNGEQVGGQGSILNHRFRVQSGNESVYRIKATQQVAHRTSTPVTIADYPTREGSADITVVIEERDDQACRGRVGRGCGAIGAVGVREGSLLRATLLQPCEGDEKAICINGRTSIAAINHDRCCDERGGYGFQCGDPRDRDHNEVVDVCKDEFYEGVLQETEDHFPDMYPDSTWERQWKYYPLDPSSRDQEYWWVGIAPSGKLVTQTSPQADRGICVSGEVVFDKVVARWRCK